MEPIEIYGKELSINKMLTLAQRKFKELWPELLFVVLLLMLPIDLIIALAPDFKIGGFSGFEGILTGIVQIFITLVIAHLVYSSFEHKKVSYKEAMRFALGRFGDSITTSIIQGLLMVVLLVALIVPGIIFGVYWQFAIYAVAIHGLRDMKALRRSKDIVKGRWWKTLGYSIVFYAIIIVAILVISIPFMFMPDMWLTEFVSGGISSFALAFMTVLFTIFYLNFDSTKAVVKTASETTPSQAL